MTDPKPDCTVGHRLCTPKLRHGPSGLGFWHDHDCPARPGQKVDLNEYVGSQPPGAEPWGRRRW